MDTQRFKNFQLSSLVPILTISVALTGCLAGQNEQFFETPSSDALASTAEGAEGPLDPSAIPQPSNTPAPATPTPAPTATPFGQGSALVTQNFSAATQAVKKIDLLFVIDNSGSMSNKQTNLANGFAAFANTFFRRSDLDICTTIITSDRFVGKVGSGSYQRERPVGCTKPAGWQSWSNAQMQTYIDGLITSFTQKANVGTTGSGTEMTGKSLISYLYNLNAWGDTIDPAVHTSFFRSDAVANISFVTDENNWYQGGSNQAESVNDLPAQTGASIYNAPQLLDNRKGLKNYLDEFFTAIRPGQGLSYSVMGLIEVNYNPTPAQVNGPALAKNIAELVQLVGRESTLGNVEGTASDYTNVYNGIATNLVIRAGAFNLTHNIYEPHMPNLNDLTVSIVRANSGGIVTLNYGSDFTVLMPNGISINQATLNTTQVGDQVRVTYRYLQ